jgi:hypothetical protein
MALAWRKSKKKVSRCGIVGTIFEVQKKGYSPRISPRIMFCYIKLGDGYKHTKFWRRHFRLKTEILQVRYGRIGPFLDYI